MHPAKSVIFFTTASGAGYGLLIWLGLFGAAGWLPADRDFGLAAFALAFALVTAGLLSSTFHLGHPERAWRAMSQWRSSWLSREGLAAVLTYVPAGLHALAWVVLQRTDGLAAGIGLASAAMAIVTVYCTAMIYASLRPIRAWHNHLTTAGYLLFSAMTGAVLLFALMLLFGLDGSTAVGRLAMVLAVAGAILKLRYWRFLDHGAPHSTAETATGLGDLGKVRLLEAPHSEENYLLQEMGYRIARKHAARLRLIALVLGFAGPVVMIGLALMVAGAAAPALALAAVATGGVGMVIERWLFFAEATHAVTLYYGIDAA